MRWPAVAAQAVATLTLCLPTPAMALPTPDVVIGTISSLPAIVATLLALFTLVAMRVRTLAERLDDPRTALARAFVAASMAAFVAAIFAFAAVSRDETRERNLAAYYRCDLAAHERLTEGSGRRFFAERSRRTTFAELEALIRSGRDPILLFVGTRLQYESGIPEVSGRRFTHVQGVSNAFAPGLRRALASLGVEAHARPVAIANPPAFIDRETEAELSAWPSIWTLETDCADDSCLVEFEPYAKRRNRGGDFEPAALTPNELRDWPVTLETWLYDEAAVRFPNMTTLLSDAAFDRALADPELIVVAPFSSTLRSLEVQRFYLRELLDKRPHVATIDFDSPSYERELDTLATQLGARPYVIAALTKYDWLYFGTDIGFRLSQKGSRYLGASLGLDDHAARRALSQADARSTAELLAPIRSALARLGALGSILGLALLLRLVCAPFAWFEALSAHARKRISKDSLYLGLERVALRSIGVRPTLAALGLFAAWLPLLVAWPLLLYEGGPLAGSALERPSVAGLAMLLLVVLARVSMRAGVPRGSRMVYLSAAFAGAAWLASELALGLSLFATCFIALGLPLEWWATRRVSTRLRVAEEVQPGATIRVGDVELSSLPSFRASASKAGRLAELARLSTTLFRVPKGVVLEGPLTDPAKSRVAATLATEHLIADSYAVRSSAPKEDASGSTQAGKFLTKLKVAPESLADAIEAVARSYGDNEDRAIVIVQEMAPARSAGVAFSRSFASPAITHVELGLGLADARLSGEEQPSSVGVSWLSGRSFPSKLDGAAEDAALVSRVLEVRFRAPQDVEWVHDGRTLFVVQSRDAAISSSIVQAEQERIVRSLDRFDGKLVPGDALPPNASILSMSIVARTYSDGLPRAIRALGGRPGRVAALVAFGRLYTATGRISIRTPKDATARIARLRSSIDELEAKATLRTHDAKSIHAALLEVSADTSVSFETALLAAALDHGGSSRVRTITTELFEGLGAVGRGEQLAEFVAKFGHRAEHDYELALPSFAEDRSALELFARRHARWPASRTGDRSGTAVEIIRLKERAKDVVVRRLRSVRPALLALGARLGIDPFALELDDLLLDDAELAEAARRRAAEREILLRQELPERPTREDFERLGADIGDGAAGVRFISGGAFEGRVVFGPPEGDPSGLVCVVPSLSPELTASLPGLAGVLAKAGGALSHPAIVARELGVPIAISADEGMSLREGDFVEVRASGVTVRRGV